MAWAAPHATSSIRGRVVVPGSKSETNRALLLSALADGPSCIAGALASRDSALMIAALRGFGVEITDEGPVLRVKPPARFSGGNIVDCGLAGTVMRFLPPVAALATGKTTFLGDRRAGERPMKPVLDVLRSLGAEADSDTLPFTITPPENWGYAAALDGSASSQFISGPLLAAARFPHGLRLRHVGAALPSRPHIDMSVQMLRARGIQVEQPDENTWIVAPGPIQPLDEKISPDLTNAAVFLGAALLTAGSVSVANWPESTTQPGSLFLELSVRFGGQVTRDGDAMTVTGGKTLAGADIDLSAASELTPVVAAIALFADGVTTISGVGHIRGHETDRLAAISREFTAAGGDVTQTADGLRIVGGRQLRPHRFETYADHRMAHAAALVGLRVPGTTLTDVSCTSKTMPTFAAEWEGLCGV